MLGALLLLQAATLGGTAYGIDEAMAPPPGPPAWADEFRGRAPAPARWRYDTARNRTGWANHELQYYAADRPANARVEGGALVIEARAEDLSRAGLPDWGGQAYSSARLVSRRTFRTGFLEVRARLPCGRGGWPAIWLLPEGAPWPDGGEIDVMEMVGWQPRVVHATVHSALFNHRLGTQRGAERIVPGACTGFHRYQLDWRPDRIRVGVDGRAFFAVRNDRPGGAGAWPFDRPMSLILNLAVGGDWGGQRGGDAAAFPLRLRIDHVRWWGE